MNKTLKVYEEFSAKFGISLGIMASDGEDVTDGSGTSSTDFTTAEEDDEDDGGGLEDDRDFATSGEEAKLDSGLKNLGPSTKLKGVYRRLVVRPRRLRVSVVQPRRGAEPLMPPRLPSLPSPSGLSPATPSFELESPLPHSPQHELRSEPYLSVSFALPPSAYATVCVRELCHTPPFG